MTKQKLHIIKKIISRTLWVLIGAGTFVLLGAAMTKKSLKKCQKVEITIKGAHNNIFIDEKDIDSLLNQVNEGQLVGKELQRFDLGLIEETLEKNEWIKKAEVYFDNNEVLWVNINEREPIARIFTRNGNSFYIDSSRTSIPLSEKFSARLPIFTSYPDTLKNSSDSLLTWDIKTLSNYILKDSFWMAQIDQIDISNDRTFQLVPKIGNQLILFGTTERYQDKFHYLFLFYRDVLAKTGWNKYSKISVEYAGQIITVKRGAEEVKMDSIKASEIMKNILLKAQLQISDTSGVQLAQSDEQVQQVVPLINAEMPDENITLLSRPGSQLVGNINILKSDSLKKKFLKPDSISRNKSLVINNIKNEANKKNIITDGRKKQLQKVKQAVSKKVSDTKVKNTDY